MKQNLAKSMSVSFKPDLFEKIDNYCEQRGCTRSWLINKAVSMYLSECLENIADYNAATKAWEEYEKDGKKSFSAADVFAEAGL